MVVLKNSEPKRSDILAELLYKCSRECFFPHCWKVLLVVTVFKNVRERSTTKKYRPVSLLFVVNKAFEKFVNNRLLIL